MMVLKLIEAPDPSSGLKYPAFTGARKQSGLDAECLFSPDLADFMSSKGYQFEARYICIIGIGGEQVTKKTYLKENTQSLAGR